MLTREYILSLKAGREMDALVAEHIIVFDSLRQSYDIDNEPNGIWFGKAPDLKLYHVPQFSESISASWEVVEKFYYSDIRKLNGCNWGAWVGRGDGHSHNATSVTAPEAICKAALLTTIQGVDNT